MSEIDIEKIVNPYLSKQVSLASDTEISLLCEEIQNLFPPLQALFLYESAENSWVKRKEAYFRDLVRFLAPLNKGEYEHFKYYKDKEPLSKGGVLMRFWNKENPESHTNADWCYSMPVYSMPVEKKIKFAVVPEKGLYVSEGSTNHFFMRCKAFFQPVE